MVFKSEKGGGREGKVSVAFFRRGFVLLLLTIGLFPESEGLSCHYCYSYKKGNDDCVSPSSYFEAVNCEAFCIKIYSNETKNRDGNFFRSCAQHSQYFNMSILYECAEKFFGKEGEGACLDVTPENLKIVEDCHWSQVGKDFISKYPGFGFSFQVFGMYEFGEKSCFCKEDLCNGGPIPGIKETEEKPSGVACCQCSSKPNPTSYHQDKCYPYHESPRAKTWCPYDTHCFKRTGTQGPPWSFYPVEYTERGCSSKLVPNATIEDTEELIKCLKKYGGCVSVKSEAGSECFKDLMNNTAVQYPRRDVFDFNEMDELCVCEGDLCNSEAPNLKTTTSKPTEISEVIPEPMYEETQDEDEEKEVENSTSSHFMWWLFLVLLIIGLFVCTCLIMFRKPKEFVEINGEF